MQIIYPPTRRFLLPPVHYKSLLTRYLEGTLSTLLLFELFALFDIICSTHILETLSPLDLQDSSFSLTYLATPSKYPLKTLSSKCVFQCLIPGPLHNCFGLLVTDAFMNVKKSYALTL